MNYAMAFAKIELKFFFLETQVHSSVLIASWGTFCRILCLITAVTRAARATECFLTLSDSLDFFQISCLQECEAKS